MVIWQRVVIIGGWALLQACGERPEGPMTASYDAQESPTVQNDWPQVQSHQGGAIQPWGPTASGEGGAALGAPARPPQVLSRCVLAKSCSWDIPRGRRLL